MSNMMDEVRVNSAKSDELRQRAETVLGWPEGGSNCFSLPALSAWVREKDPGLSKEINDHTARGLHFLSPPTKNRRR